jgi:hypothetical protein
MLQGGQLSLLGCQLRLQLLGLVIYVLQLLPLGGKNLIAGIQLGLLGTQCS